MLANSDLTTTAEVCVFVYARVHMGMYVCVHMYVCLN